MLPLYRLAVIALSSIATSVFAQQTPTHKSVVSAHKIFEDAPVADWKKSNDTVRERGGWRAYLSEAQGSEAQASNTQGHADTAKNPHAAHLAPAARKK